MTYEQRLAQIIVKHLGGHCISSGCWNDPIKITKKMKPWEKETYLSMNNERVKNRFYYTNKAKLILDEFLGVNVKEKE